MEVVFIEQSYISRLDIQKAIETFKKIQKGEAPPSLVLEARIQINNIDILLAGYLMLFTYQVPNLHIEIRFPSGISYRAQYKLKQYGLYGYLLTGKSIFTAILPNDIIIQFNYNHNAAFPVNEFVLSDSFMLLLPVCRNDQMLYSRLFEIPIDDLVSYPLTDGVEEVVWQNDNKALYTAFSDKLTKEANPGKREKCITDLGRLAFFNCLHEAKILHHYVHQDQKEHTQSGKELSANTNTQTSKAEPDKKQYDLTNYYEQLIPVFSELKQRPLIHQFVFASLIAAAHLPSTIKLANEKDTICKIWNLWQFTENLVRSLQELSKNIKEHTTTGYGVITASVIKKDDPDIDRNTLLSEILTGIDFASPDSPNAILDIHVTDLGEVGIIPTFLQAAQKLLTRFEWHQKIHSLIQDDINLLSDQLFGLKDLFSQETVIRLNQQCWRAISHIGLLILRKLIEKNKGILKVDTQDHTQRHETVCMSQTLRPAESVIQHGTYFTIILPLSRDISYSSHLPGSIQLPAEPTPNELKGIENLFAFQHIPVIDKKPTIENGDKRIYSYTCPAQTVRNRQDEYTLWKDFQDKLQHYAPPGDDNDTVLVHVDLDKVSLDASALLRMVGYWEMYYSKTTLLLSNIPNVLYRELMNINIALTEGNPNIGFWNEHSPLIFYNYGTTAGGTRFYFTDMFLGKTIDDFHWLNKLLQRNHFNATSLLNNQIADTTPEKIRGIITGITSVAFFKGSMLLPFDLVLPATGNTSMFENNALVLLKNEIEIQREPAIAGDLMTLVKHFSGYKVARSHYRIGTKLHISDFYYAKRIFQNNFFASRFAFILTREIIAAFEKLNERDPEQFALIKQKGITLIGYGLYAELLLSLTEKFIRDYGLFNKAKVNHDLISDETHTTRMKSVELLPYVIIVVPIACTFSTAIKIEEKIQGQKPVTILSPHYNLLHISGNTTVDGEITEMEREFGWTSKNLGQKEIEIQSFFNKQEGRKIQKYFIALPTQWEKIENCSICTPTFADGKENLMAERPLFETDRTSVTPSIAFDYPRGRLLENRADAERTLFLTPEMILFRRFTKSNSHFIYSIDTEQFLEKNLPGVKKWLHEIKASISFKTDFPDYMHTLILSSCHYSNAAFISLINEELFNSSANIIHCDTDNDYLKNFEIIYGHDIDTADRIIYVDDTLKSGSNFGKINEFILHILSHYNEERVKTGRKPKSGQGIYACMILINKSQQFTHQTILGKLVGQKQVYGFANLHLYTSLSLNNTSTIVLEKEKYNRLIMDSFLDSIKMYLYHKIQRLNEAKTSDLLNPVDETLVSTSKSRHLYMIEATHLIYKYFSETDRALIEQITFTDFITHLHAVVKSPFRNKEIGAPEILNMHPLDVAILKAVSQNPFTQYEPLRKYVFKWVIQLFDQHLDQIAAEIDRGTFIITGFHGLKFLIRRVAQVNSNYLISAKMFTMLKKLFQKKGIPFLRSDIIKELNKNSSKAEIFDEKRKKDLEAITSFPVFVCAQYKELLSKNPFRSIKLERLLIDSYESDIDEAYRQLIFTLRAENAIIIQKFCEWLELDDKWNNLYYDPSNKTLPNKDNQLIKEFLDAGTTQKHQFVRLLEEFMSVNPATPAIQYNESFLHYLWIRNYLNLDAKITGPSLTERTSTLFEKIRLIFESQNAFTGIFLAIANGPGNSSLVYEQNSQETEEIDSNNWPGQNNKYLQNFIDGIRTPNTNYIDSLVDLNKIDIIGKWKDMYATRGEDIVHDLSFDFPSKEISRLVLLRLSKRIDIDHEKTLGVLGIYFKHKHDPLTDPTRLRYLLLLKENLSEYIERHYMNNEFRDWLFAEHTKRLAFLSGHGKEMLKELINKPNTVYRDICWNLEHLQAIMILHDRIRGHENLDDIPNTFNKFYNVNGSKVIDENYFSQLKNMACEIYQFEEIETAVDCDIDVVVPPGFSFAFNKKILDLICFELIINAKKNRWQFLAEDKHLIREYNKNQLAIRVTPQKGTYGENQMLISIMNIGPQVNTAIMEKLNHETKNVKPNDIIAGTSLLKTLIHKILNGKISFESKRICDNTDLHEFTVYITLNEMNNYDDLKKQTTAN